MKQIAFVIRINSSNSEATECLFRFEEGVTLTLDPRIPKPQELYRDVAFHRIDKILDWNLTAPIEEWNLDKMKGVIRPYYQEIRHLMSYKIKQQVEFRDFLLKTAIMDYTCGVTDRNISDILLVNNNPVLVDSGLSFVDGTDFVCQASEIRKCFFGETIPFSVLGALSKLNEKIILDNTSNLLTQQQIQQILARNERIVERGVII